MLNEIQIKSAIANNEIQISYYFKKSTDGKIEVVNDSFEQYGDKLLDSNRLKITLGPIIKVLGKTVPKKFQFNNHKDCFDLRKNKNEFILNPGESIVILTNENITLDGNHAALIIPRVSLSEVGIILTSAYIDAYYKGILRLNIHNNSKHPFKLNTLEVIAQCFFFDFNGNSVPPIRKEYFANKSVFYSQNWETIFETDAEPFPIKKREIQTNPVKKFFVNIVKTIYVFLNENAVFTTIISIIIFGVFIYSAITNYMKDVSNIKSNYASYSNEIIIETGEKIGTKRVRISDCKKDDILGILCNNDNVSFEIYSDGTNEVEIIFSYELDEEVKNKQQVDFNYTIVKKID